MENQQTEDLKFNKFASKKDRYHYCKLIGLNSLTKKFGLSPEQYAENLLADYQKNEIEQWNIEPTMLCMEYVKEPYFQSVDQVLNTVTYMISLQLARDPSVRSYVRELYIQHACITVKPTFPRGFKEIDENHLCFKYKYLKMKPCNNLKEDEFLKLTNAEQDGLLTIKFEISNLKNYTYVESNYSKNDSNDLNKIDQEKKNNVDDDWDDEPKSTVIKKTIDSINQESMACSKTIIEKLKSFYHKDEFSYNVEQWNNLRSKIIEDMCNLYLYPEFEKELRHKLLSESKTFVYRECAKRLREIIKVAPYTTESLTLDDESNNGLKVISITYSTFEDAPNGSSASTAICACINGDGELDEFIKLNKLTTKLNRGYNIDTEKNDFLNGEKKEKIQELKDIENFIINKMPNVIVVASENKDALIIIEDIKNILKKLEENKEKIGQINVELVDNEMAKIFSSTNSAEQEFGKQTPSLVIQAVALARFLQDPLLCFSQLFNTGLT